MRHFAHLDAGVCERLFDRQPEEFDRYADLATLSMALGATLYMPGTRTDLAKDLRRARGQGVISAVICLEDAIADGDVEPAQENVIEQLRLLADGSGPLTFVRVRRPEQITTIVARLGTDAHVLTGFVLPKFAETNGAEYLHALTAAQSSAGVRLFGMPVLESVDVIHRETRDDALLAVRRLVDKFQDNVLAMRVGATDLCSAYGLRRARGLTVYDVHVVAEVIADIVNVFGRADDAGHVVTGPVWEYFSGAQRLFKPQLRETPFGRHNAIGLRRDLLSAGLDGLLREVMLDKANGLTGKTVIHPTHVPAVHALMVVTAEEYADATDVLSDCAAGGGVRASSYQNKMNESKPHRAWAERTLRRASAFGVAADGISAVDLLVAGSTT